MQVNLPTLATISDTPTHIPDIPNLIISQHGIQNLLSMLDVQKTSRPDLISPCIFKNCVNEIVLILQVILTQSLSTSSLPNDWLSANICPVFKKGNRSSVINYQTISLTCVNTMEQIIYHSIMDELDQNSI